MPNYVISPPQITGLPIDGTDALFPVRRVYCIGRNYAAHAIEMGHDPDREPPFFFQKNPNNLDPSGTFLYPPHSSDVHHEAEMYVALKSGGANIAVEDALDCIYGYGLSLDMTRRDLQGQMKKLGRPWEIGKAFERSAPCGPIYPASMIGYLGAGRLVLTVNGETRQEGDLNQMISYPSQYFELASGDIIQSGTPAGVGPIAKGDVMVVTIDGLGSLSVTVE